MNAGVAALNSYSEETYQQVDLASRKGKHIDLTISPIGKFHYHTMTEIKN